MKYNRLFYLSLLISFSSCDDHQFSSADSFIDQNHVDGLDTEVKATRQKITPWNEVLGLWIEAEKSPLIKYDTFSKPLYYSTIDSKFNGYDNTVKFLTTLQKSNCKWEIITKVESKFKALNNQIIDFDKLSKNKDLVAPSAEGKGEDYFNISPKIKKRKSNMAKLHPLGWLGRRKGCIVESYHIENPKSSYRSYKTKITHAFSTGYNSEVYFVMQVRYKNSNRLVETIYLKSVDIDYTKSESTPYFMLRDAKRLSKHKYRLAVAGDITEASIILAVGITGLVLTAGAVAPLESFGVGICLYLGVLELFGFGLGGIRFCTTFG